MIKNSFSTIKNRQVAKLALDKLAEVYLDRRAKRDLAKVFIAYYLQAQNNNTENIYNNRRKYNRALYSYRKNEIILLLIIEIYRIINNAIQIIDGQRITQVNSDSLAAGIKLAKYINRISMPFYLWEINMIVSFAMVDIKGFLIKFLMNMGINAIPDHLQLLFNDDIIFWADYFNNEEPYSQPGRNKRTIEILNELTGEIEKEDAITDEAIPMIEINGEEYEI